MLPKSACSAADPLGRLAKPRLPGNAARSTFAVQQQRLRAADGLLAVRLRPLDDGLRRPLLLVDALLYASRPLSSPTLVEVAEHHQHRASLRQLVRVANGHVETLRQTDAVAHGDHCFRVGAVLVAVALVISSSLHVYGLEVAADVGQNALVRGASPESELDDERIGRLPSTPGPDPSGASQGSRGPSRRACPTIKSHR